MSKDKKLKKDETIIWIVNQYNQTFDFLHKPLQSQDKKVEMLYIKTVVDGQQLQENIIKPFFEMNSIEEVESYFNSLPNQQDVTSKEQVIEELSKGSIVIAINDTILLFDFKKVHTDTVLESNVEPTIQGPQYALSEDLITNINIVRQRYHQPSLVVEMFTIGKKNKQSVAVLYDQDLVNEKSLNDFKKRLQKENSDIILASGDLLRHLNNRKRSLLPTLLLTERSDRISYNLAGGKIVTMVDGDSMSIIAPAVFYDFFNSMEDFYHPFWVTKFLVTLRYIGLITCLTFPGLYVAITSYNPDVFRAELALSIAGSRIGVPYPSYMEVLFMLIVMELLTEASIRLPKAISATATTVGGLILGTAVTEAALASNIMVIIVASVAISTFVIPINEMSFSIRAGRYIVLFFSTIFGLTGLLLSCIWIIMYMSNKTSFGVPYFKIFLQGKKDEA